MIRQIVFVMHAARHPGRLAEFLASLYLVRSSAMIFAGGVRSLYGNSRRVMDQFQSIRTAYEENGVFNVVVDGSVSFPIDPVADGVSVEFWCVMVPFTVWY